jgi:hypothetical protein
MYEMHFNKPIVLDPGFRRDDKTVAGGRKARPYRTNINGAMSTVYPPFFTTTFQIVKINPLQ